MKTFTKIFMSAILTVSSTTLWAAEVAPKRLTIAQEKIVKAYDEAIKTKHLIEETKPHLEKDAEEKKKARDKKERLTNVSKNQTEILQELCKDFCGKSAIPEKKEFCDTYCKFKGTGRIVESKPAAGGGERKEATA